MTWTGPGSSHIPLWSAQTASRVELKVMIVVAETCQKNNASGLSGLRRVKHSHVVYHPRSALAPASSALGPLVLVLHHLFCFFLSS